MANDITETVIAATGGTVVLGRRGAFAGSVWIVMQGWRYGPAGPDESPRLVCIHATDPHTIGATHTPSSLRELRLWSDDFRIAPDGVRGTPAAQSER